MNALLLLVVVASVQNEGALTPPPMPPPVDVAPQYTPPPRTDAPVLGTAPKKERVRTQNGGRIAAGVSLLAVGYVASIVNTTVYWFSDGIRNFSWFGIIGLPLGIVVSALPVIGPAAALIADLVTGQTNQVNYPVRTLVNVGSLALQVTGLVLLVTMPRGVKKAEKDVFALTNFGAAPVEGGAVVGFGGRW